MVADAVLSGCGLVLGCRQARRGDRLPVDGRRVTFAENVFYRFRGWKLEEVWSVVDKAAIEARL